MASCKQLVHLTGSDETPPKIKQNLVDVFSSVQSSAQKGEVAARQQKPSSKAGCFGKISSVHTLNETVQQVKEGLAM